MSAGVLSNPTATVHAAACQSAVIASRAAARQATATWGRLAAAAPHPQGTTTAVSPYTQTRSADMGAAVVVGVGAAISARPVRRLLTAT